MRNADQQSGTLLKSFPVQIDYSVLRYHIMHQMARRGDTGALFQERSDLALAFSGFRSDRDDRFAAFGAGSAINKIKLSADAGLHIRTE